MFKPAKAQNPYCAITLDALDVAVNATGHNITEFAWLVPTESYGFYTQIEPANESESAAKFIHETLEPLFNHAAVHSFSITHYEATLMLPTDLDRELFDDIEELAFKCVEEYNTLMHNDLIPNSELIVTCSIFALITLAFK